jgi:hypothetical protein
MMLFAATRRTSSSSPRVVRHPYDSLPRITHYTIMKETPEATESSHVIPATLNAGSGSKRRTSHIYKHGNLVVEQDGGCNYWECTECKGARFHTEFCED